MTISISQLAKHVDFPEVIRETAKDIADVKIQGATNVAISSINAVLKWLSEVVSEQKGQVESSKILTQALFYLEFLANVRPNEPLARNGYMFIKSQVQEQAAYLTGRKLLNAFKKLAEKYLKILKDAKEQIVKKNLEFVKDARIIFTHCHSSTAEKLIIAANNYAPKKVISTETRPLYQGRITATNLLNAGVETIMIVDSAAPGFIADDRILPVDVVLIGADEISTYGDAINKIGSYAIGLASHYAQKPLYVVTPLLKLHYETMYQLPAIEQRPASEVWEDAPKGLMIINPAFEFVPRTFIKGFLTEVGFVLPEEVEKKALELYPWIKAGF